MSEFLEVVSHAAQVALVFAFWIGIGFLLLEFFIAGPRQRKAEQRWAAEPIHHREWPITSTTSRGPRRSNGRAS